MPRDWHDTFGRWAKPPTETEESKADRAASRVRETLRSAPSLQGRNFDVVAIGSYRNNTNVRSASDVDLAAVLRSAEWSDFPADGSLTREMLGVGAVDYGLVEFRKDLNIALRHSFGAAEITPGKIALTIDENRGRLPADVTPYLVHRRYTGRRLPAGSWESHLGIETRPADASNRRIIQWPNQHYDQGVAKNNATNRRFKRVVRILKCLRDEIAEQGSPQARQIARATRSCFLEHTISTVPSTSFNQSENTYYHDVRRAVAHLYNVARTPAANAMVELGGMQRLMRPDEPWSAKTLEEFMLTAWQYVGFTNS